MVRMPLSWGRVYLLVNLAERGRDGRSRRGGQVKGHGVTKNTRGTQTRNTHRRPRLGQTPTFNDTPWRDHHLSRRPRRRWISRLDRSRYLRSQRRDRPGNSPGRPVNNTRDPYTSKTSNCKRYESRNVYSAINLPADADTARDVFFFSLFLSLSFSSSGRRRRHRGRCLAEIIINERRNESP